MKATLDARAKFPIDGYDKLVFLNNIIDHPNIEIGDYSYYDDAETVDNFLKNILYFFDFIGDKLVIGKFCQIASGVRFLMNGGNHEMHGFSTFPFRHFVKDYKYDQDNFTENIKGTIKGDTVIGNDVWLGNGATIMPGVKIGDGAIIGTSALVTKDVAPYSIVGGNPAKLIRMRFDDSTISRLLQLKWWRWPIEKIVANLPLLQSGNIDELEKEVSKP